MGPSKPDPFGFCSSDKAFAPWRAPRFRCLCQGTGNTTSQTGHHGPNGASPLYWGCYLFRWCKNRLGGWMVTAGAKAGVPTPCQPFSHHLILESSDHRLVWVGRDLSRPSSPTPAMGRDISNQIRVLRAPSSLAWNGSRDGASPTSLGNLGQGLSTLSVNDFFLRSSRNLPSFSLNPLSLVPSLQALLKTLSPSLWEAPLKYQKAAVRSPRSLLFPRLSSPSSPSLSSQQGGSSLWVTVVARDACLDPWTHHVIALKGRAEGVQEGWEMNNRENGIWMSVAGWDITDPTGQLLADGRWSTGWLAWVQTLVV